jgi:hypothetical protein
MDKSTKVLDSYLQPVLDIWSEKEEQTICPISGNCMAPLIREGDLLVIKHGNQDMHTGDVAVYGEPGEFYVHRVINIQRRNGKNYYVFKPDKYGYVKQDINADKVIGKVIEVRGANGNFNFNSLFWKCVNPFLATVIYSNWRSYTRDTLFWKTINYFFLIWHKIKPSSYSFSLNFLRIVYQANRIWFRMRLFKSSNK